MFCETDGIWRKTPVGGSIVLDCALILGGPVAIIRTCLDGGVWGAVSDTCSIVTVWIILGVFFVPISIIAGTLLYRTCGSKSKRAKLAETARKRARHVKDTLARANSKDPRYKKLPPDLYTLGLDSDDEEEYVLLDNMSVSETGAPARPAGNSEANNSSTTTNTTSGSGSSGGSSSPHITIVVTSAPRPAAASDADPTPVTTDPSTSIAGGAYLAGNVTQEDQDAI